MRATFYALSRSILVPVSTARVAAAGAPGADEPAAPASNPGKPEAPEAAITPAPEVTAAEAAAAREAAAAASAAAAAAALKAMEDAEDARPDAEDTEGLLLKPAHGCTVPMPLRLLPPKKERQPRKRVPSAPPLLQVFLSGLPLTATDDDLLTYCGSIGEARLPPWPGSCPAPRRLVRGESVAAQVAKVNLLKKEAKPEENKGFAFVSYKSREDAAKAVAELGKTELMDRKASAPPSPTTQQRTPRCGALSDGRRCWLRSRCA